jgi:hypothetical protein
MGEITLAAASEKRAQLVPNWNGMMMPVTTPMAKETAKMRIQKREMRSQISSRWKKYSPSNTAMKEASPTVKAGSRMCQPITQAHCRRDRNSGSKCMLGVPL